MKVWRDKGIKVEMDGETISLDSGGEADYYLMSHAHSDHLIRRKNVDIFCSKETASLVMHRYEREFKFKNEKNIIPDIKFIDSGHILGSKSFYLADGETLLYTGDFSNQNRLFLKKADYKQADNLILETTFGKNVYTFPNQAGELDRLKDWVEDGLKQSSVIVMGYSLGKAQLVSKLLEDLPVYTHGTVSKMNQVHSFLGVSMKTKELDLNHPPKQNFVYIMPPHLNKNLGFGLKRKFNMKSAICSGWAINPFYKNMFNADESFVLSDHADFEGLCETVKKVNPKKVYTMHGFSTEFSRHLKKEGYETEVLE